MTMSRAESRVARYRGPILSAQDAAVPRFRGRADLLSDPHVTAPGADTVGHQRLGWLGLDSANCRTHLCFDPVGQSSPPHDAPCEHIVTGLRGEFEFRVGGSTYPLRPFDQLFIPADVLYSYANIGPAEAMFFVVMSPTMQGWPNMAPPDAGRPAPGTVAPGDEWYQAPQRSEAETERAYARSGDQWFAHPWLSSPQGSTWGRQRVLYPGLDAMTCRTAVIDVPVGQASPEHQVPVEQIVTALQGTTTWTVGDTVHTLREYDQLFIPANARHGFRNLELDSTARVFLCIANP